MCISAWSATYCLLSFRCASNRNLWHRSVHAVIVRSPAAIGKWLCCCSATELLQNAYNPQSSCSVWCFMISIPSKHGLAKQHFQARCGCECGLYRRQQAGSVRVAAHFSILNTSQTDQAKATRVVRVRVWVRWPTWLQRSSVANASLCKVHEHGRMFVAWVFAKCTTL